MNLQVFSSLTMISVDIKWCFKKTSKFINLQLKTCLGKGNVITFTPRCVYVIYRIIILRLFNVLLRQLVIIAAADMLNVPKIKNNSPDKEKQQTENEKQ